MTLTPRRQRVRHPRQRQEPDVEPHARLGGGAGDVRLRARARRSRSPACWSAASAWASRCARRSICCRRTRRWSSPSWCPPSSSGTAARSGRWPDTRSKDGAWSGRGRRRRARRCARARPVRRRAARRGQRPGRVHRVAQRRPLRRRGLAAARAALKGGGVLAVWSAREDRKFEQRLRYGGFTVEVQRVRGAPEEGRAAAHDLPRHPCRLTVSETNAGGGCWPEQVMPSPSRTPPRSCAPPGARAEDRMWPMLVDARACRTTNDRSRRRPAVALVRAVARRNEHQAHVAIAADDDALYRWFLLYEAQGAEAGVRVIRSFVSSRTPSAGSRSCRPPASWPDVDPAITLRGTRVPILSPFPHAPARAQALSNGVITT